MYMIEGNAKFDLSVVKTRMSLFSIQVHGPLPCWALPVDPLGSLEFMLESLTSSGLEPTVMLVPLSCASCSFLQTLTAGLLYAVSFPSCMAYSPWKLPLFFFPFCRQGNWDSERSSDLSKAIQLVNRILYHHTFFPTWGLGARVSKPEGQVSVRGKSEQGELAFMENRLWTRNCAQCFSQPPSVLTILCCYSLNKNN